MRPGRMLAPATSTTSAPGAQLASGPVTTASTRPSLITRLASRTGGRPVPSISVPPRRTSTSGPEAVERRGVVADDLLPRGGGQVAELALDVFLRIRPDAVRMGEVGAPHDLVLAQLVEQLDADRIRLVRGPALALPVLARRHREREVLELVLPLGIHAPEHVGDPADARLAEHQANPRIVLEHAAEDHGREHVRH